jgi:hypothetical protein
MYKIPRGSSENAQNPMIDFEYCTKSQEELPKYTQSHEELSNIHNPMGNFQKCTKSNEELPKMHKFTGETSKYEQNPTRIF